MIEVLAALGALGSVAYATAHAYAQGASRLVPGAWVVACFVYDLTPAALLFAACSAPWSALVSIPLILIGLAAPAAAAAISVTTSRRVVEDTPPRFFDALEDVSDREAEVYDLVREAGELRRRSISRASRGA